MRLSQMAVPEMSFDDPVMTSNRWSDITLETSVTSPQKGAFGSSPTELATINETALPTSTSPDVEAGDHLTVDTVDHSCLPEPKRDQVAAPGHYDLTALNMVKQEMGPEWNATDNEAPPSLQELFYDGTNQYLAGGAFYHPHVNNWDWRSKSHGNTKSIEVHTSTHIPQSLTTTLPSPEEAQGQHPTPPFSKPAQTEIGPLFDAGVIDDTDDIDMDDCCTVDSAQAEEMEELHLKNNDLGIVAALQARQERKNLDVRSFTSLLDRPNMLDTHVPSPQSSPLNDSMTARIFCHFINVTAPAISLNERHPPNPSLIFQGHPCPKSQQHIWACKYILN